MGHFSSKELAWHCDSCYFLNPLLNVVCAACLVVRPQLERDLEISEFLGSLTTKSTKEGSQEVSRAEQPELSLGKKLWNIKVKQGSKKTSGSLSSADSSAESHHDDDSLPDSLVSSEPPSSVPADTAVTSAINSFSGHFAKDEVEATEATASVAMEAALGVLSEATEIDSGLEVCAFLDEDTWRVDRGRRLAADQDVGARVPAYGPNTAEWFQRTREQREQIKINAVEIAKLQAQLVWAKKNAAEIDEPVTGENETCRNSWQRTFRPKRSSAGKKAQVCIIWPQRKMSSKRYQIRHSSASLCLSPSILQDCVKKVIF